MSEPLPALRPLIARARSAIAAALSERTDNTARVWLPDVRGLRVVPPDELCCNGIETVSASDVDSGSGHLGDRYCHRGVVGPFSRRPVERAATDHVDRDLGLRVGEFVAGAECVSCCGAEQNAGRSIGLLCGEFHSHLFGSR